MDYKKIGLKCGLEIHRQLATKHKLFCNCSAAFQDKESVFEVTRKLRPVAGELGEVDTAAAFETLKGKTFRYKVYLNETCLVELDEEPPHPLNPEALDIALQIAVMLNCDIPEEIHIMRKTVLDGSNTSGFQRTALVGMNGFLETSFGKVGIDNVSIEEDACQIIKKGKNTVIYGLNRLGIPLVEIGTSPHIKTPEQAREVAEKIGIIIKSTGKARSGIGSVRQDLNISIKGGNRVEIKGVQDLGSIPRVVEEEVKRQTEIIKKGKKVSRDVRRALPNGKTEFMRPLPGAARMYPETDIPVILIGNKKLQAIKKNLPELLGDRAERLTKKFKLGEEVVRQIVNSGKDKLFEEITKLGTDPRLASTILTSGLKDLKRGEGVPIERVSDQKILEVFKALKGKTIVKESVLSILKELAKDPGQDVRTLVSRGGMETMSESELRDIIKKKIKEEPDLAKSDRAEKILMGLIMAEVRGKAPGGLVAKILSDELKNS